LIQNVSRTGDRHGLNEGDDLVGYWEQEDDGDGDEEKNKEEIEERKKRKEDNDTDYVD